MKINSKQYYFCLRPLQSPSFANLYQYLQAMNWRYTRFDWRADFSEKNFQFHELASQHLEFKHLLAQLLAQYYPQAMPVTYGINDQNWPVILNKLSDQNAECIWILKPSLLNNGQNIKIFEDLNQLQYHYLRPQRLGGEHVLQQYITQPHLLRGHKYSIRMFVIATNYAGAFLYPNGYLNVALHPYQPQQFADISSHLTNEHLSEDAANVVQIPTQRFDLFSSIYEQIKVITAATLSGLQQLYPDAFIAKRRRALAIFGFDFMVDSNRRVWLLEANHGPCFPTQSEHPLQHYLYHEFWQAFINSFVLPIAKQQSIRDIEYQLFEAVDLTLPLNPEISRLSE